MPINSKEAKINLVIDTLRTNSTISIRRVVKIYEMFRTTIIVRMNGRASIGKAYNNRYQLTLAKEKMFVRYILDLDSRRFAPRINDVEDIANSLFAIYYTKFVGIR